MPSTLRGIVLITMSATVFAGVDGFSKVLADSQSVWQIVWARYAIALPLILLLTPAADRRALFRTANPGPQILRGLMPIGVSVSMVLGVRHLPLAEATVILFASPFAVVALAGPLLGERVHRASWVGVGVGFAAVLLVARPGLGHVSAYAIFPLVAAAFYTFYQILTRGLANRGEAPRTTLVWTLATGTAIATPLAILTWAPVSLVAAGQMVALGLVFSVAQYLMIEAFAHAPAGVLAPFAYAQIVAATLVGVVFFDTVPDVWTLLGVVMIIAAGVSLARLQRRRA
ncbi:MAG: DMT family transporter [Rhizobiales bacterium]|nr:DMT family transporter [Hyphomicrobiales bacterium]